MTVLGFRKLLELPIELRKHTQRGLLLLSQQHVYPCARINVKLGALLPPAQNGKPRQAIASEVFLYAGWQSGNATACKTVFHRFESGPSVQTTEEVQLNKRMQSDAGKAGAADARRYVTL